MLNGDGNENGRSIIISNEQKTTTTTTKTTLHVQHAFVHFFAVVLYDFSVKPSSNYPLSITLAFFHDRNHRM